MTTDLVKTVSQIGFRSGSGLIRSCENPEILRKVLSEGLFQALSLYSDVKVESVQLMMSSILDDFQYEPADVIIDAIKDIAGGKRKIFGRVTPNDIREVIQEKLELVAIERERKHDEQKKGTYIERGSDKSVRDWIKQGNKKE